ncbi:MAG TPA: ATP-binding cassette domain-containing protein [Candidatus Gastranaerophilales bacterium]|nr:ATP-binding cassette domain-containing protein [Candidatus Gastranaerophilales bacterium]
MLVKLENVYKKFGEKEVLKDINFSVDEGEILAIVGFSGTGKSTILKIISGLIEPDAGNVWVFSEEIGMAFQYSALFDSLTIFENVAFPLMERKDLKKRYNETQITKIVSEKLDLVGLAGIENKFPNELSGGMKKRVSFARAIVTNPKIILYDEPTSGLDPVSSTVIEDYIVSLSKELNAASIVVTHQISTISHTSERVIMLYDGNIVWQGTPPELITSIDPYAYQFINGEKKGPMIAAVH